MQGCVNFKGKCMGKYGIYKVVMNDGFSIKVNASSEQSAIKIALNSGIVSAPESAVRSCKLVKAIPLNKDR